MPRFSGSCCKQLTISTIEEGKMSRIIVYVSGGNVQDVLSDRQGSEVMIVDYDNEKGSVRKLRAFRPVTCDPTYFGQTVAGLED